MLSEEQRGVDFAEVMFQTPESSFGRRKLNINSVNWVSRHLPPSVSNLVFSIFLLGSPAHGVFLERIYGTGSLLPVGEGREFGIIQVN